MAKRYFYKDTNYRLPAGQLHVVYIDAFYINDDMWANNTPPIDCLAHLTVTPDGAHWVQHGITIFMPRYSSGVVSELSHDFNWLPFTSGQQVYTLAFNGQPYGMGLNPVRVYPYAVLFPITVDIIYNVKYALEVTV